MDEIQNIPQTPDFSDIPSLGDTQGLETYLNNETLKAQGIPVQDNAQAQTPVSTDGSAPADGTTVTSGQTPLQATSAQASDTITLTREQLNAILASRGQAPIQQAQPQTQPYKPQGIGYTPQEQQFIANALSKGYSLAQINDFLIKQRGTRIDPVLEQRLAGIENYLKTQEYKSAEAAFVSKLSDFGAKWGLSEQDLTTFGNEALKQGINIAMDNVNLETVFRAVYPEQYAIRSRRITPTNSSQIYGGTSIPEGNRANTSKIEDAYVESFLKGTMPNQYAALNKK